MRKRSAILLSFLLAAWGLSSAAWPQGGARPGEVHDSSGGVLQGRISGKDLRLYVDEKIRVVPLDQVLEIRFTPKKEELERKFTFKEFGSDEKVFSGDPFPSRELEAVVRFTDNHVLAGRLATTVLYVETDAGARKVVLQSKQSGEERQKLEDLVYVNRILFQEKPREAAGQLRVRFLGPVFGPEAEVRALTRKTLIPFDLKKTEQPGVYAMPSVFGENLYVAVKEGNRVVVSWPVRDDKEWNETEKAREKELFSVTDAALRKEKNFFDARKLIAVRIEDFEVHGLVSLGRSTEKKWADQPWQLAIWRWKFDSDYHDMHYDNQKPLFRVSKLAPDAIPEVRLSAELWKMEKKDENLLEIGGKAGP